MRGKTRGRGWLSDLRSALTEAAHAASRTKHTYLATFYQRLALRCGSNRATIALGHALLVIIFHLITKQEDYHDLGSHYFDERDRSHVQQRLVHRLQALGYEVTLHLTATTPLEAPA